MRAPTCRFIGLLISNTLSVEATHFELHKRTRHVFEEALRVLQFRQVCLESQDSEHTAESREKLGKLMNASQKSCAELFNCSCPEIDRLTELARSAGAIGSRVTGKSSLSQRLGYLG